MKYEYFVQTVGTSILHNLEDVGQEIEAAMNEDKVDAYIELGWELWQVNTLSDSNGGINGILLIYRKPRQ